MMHRRRFGFGFTPSLPAVLALALSPVPASAQLIFENGFEQSRIGGPTIDLWYGDAQTFGGAGLPQTSINILGNVSDNNGVNTLHYSLNGGPDRPLTLGKQNPRLSGFRDFNAEIDVAELRTGDNRVALKAVDGRGNLSVVEVTATYIDDVSVPMTYDIDWGTVDKISDVAQVVDGLWELTGDGVHTVEIGYDRLIAVGDLDWTDYEATAEITVHANPDQRKNPLIGLGMRWNGHSQLTAGEQPGTQWWPIGAIGSFRWFDDGAYGLQMFGSDGMGRGTVKDLAALPLNVKHLIKMRGVPQTDGANAGQITYQFKIWPASASEPAAWGIEWTTRPTSSTPDSGSLLLLAHHVDATFGKVSVRPVSD